MPKSSPKTASPEKAHAKPTFSPVRPGPSHRPSQPDYSLECNMITCKGNVGVLYFYRASDGKIGYKADYNQAIRDNKPGTSELSVLSISDHKAERTVDSGLVYVGEKNQVKDKVTVVYFDEKDDDERKFLKKHAEYLTQNTNAKSLGSGRKIKTIARAGSVLNPNDKHHLDEYVPNETVADVVIALYEEGIEQGCLDDHETAQGILSQYFSFIDLEEARELVLKRFEKKKQVHN